MIDVKIFPLGRLMANCCLLTDGSDGAVVVDPGGDPSVLLSYLERNGLRCLAILLTHGHDDHTGGVEILRKATEAPVLIGEGDADRLEKEADILLKGGEILTYGGITLEVIAAPGHTPGGLCYLTDGYLFAGDTLFRRSVGRTDLPGGDWDRLSDTLAKLVERFRDSDVVVIPGHGMTTDFKYETENNPFLL